MSDYLATFICVLCQSLNYLLGNLQAGCFCVALDLFLSFRSFGPTDKLHSIYLLGAGADHGSSGDADDSAFPGPASLETQTIAVSGSLGEDFGDVRIATFKYRSYHTIPYICSMYMLSLYIIYAV